MLKSPPITKLFGLGLTLAFSLLNQGCKNAIKMNISKNNLAQEKSPYLLQHAQNPVHWQAWQNPVLEIAAQKNKLLLISIGYSSCHWCHVMEHESFEDSTVAALMNQHYVSIKVDREERPDIDEIYMTAAQLITGRGGWPLNIIALPDGRPVWAGTYVPKAQWKKVLTDLSTLYEQQPEKFEEYATKLTQGIKQTQLLPLAEGAPEFEPEALDALFKEWQPQLDAEEGGANRAPKFPMPGVLAYLMHYGVTQNNEAALKHVSLSLTKMAYGGIYDQIGGGFARYSTDSFWKVPHFEKMLYDNAQLIALYSQAYRHFKNPLFKRIATQSLAFLEREMQHSGGPFYSALDADSEGEEGKFYVWTEAELKSVIPTADWPLFKDYYQVGPASLWEGKHILLRKNSRTHYQKAFSLSAEELSAKIDRWQGLLLKHRAKRTRPGLDDKALTSWNGLMLTAYLEAYKSFGNQAHLEKAKQLAQWFTQAQSHSGGALYHCWKNGEAYQEGLIEDYAFAAQAFAGLFSLTGDATYLKQADSWLQFAQANFLDGASGLFYTQNQNGPALFAQSQVTTDNVIPSANAILAQTLFQLSHYLGNSNYRAQSQKMLHQVKNKFLRYGESYYQWGNLYLNFSNPFYEVAISGPAAFEKQQELEQHYLPQTLSLAATKPSSLPLLENRYSKGQTRIFVCEKGACQLPVMDTQKALHQIKK
jgi:uncharacterized protein YyaL (SSP411 family)